MERPYQHRAIRNVARSFEQDGERKALLVVMATGSGKKTRTVIALVDLLMRTGWVRAVPRRPGGAVNQAAGAFKAHLPDAAPINLVTERTSEGRVFLSTYPTMMNLIDGKQEGRAMNGRPALAPPSPFMGALPRPARARRLHPDYASATGSTGAIAATIPAVASKTAYLCGFYYTGTDATAANTATQVGLNGGTVPFGFPTLALAPTVPNTIPIDEAFLPCLAATSINTPIVVNGPALGAGATQATVTAWGYYL